MLIGRSTSVGSASADRYLSDDGKTRMGQILVLDVDDRETAERIVTGDPFVEVGCFENWVIHRYRLSVEAGRLT